MLDSGLELPDPKALTAFVRLVAAVRVLAVLRREVDGAGFSILDRKARAGTPFGRGLLPGSLPFPGTVPAGVACKIYRAPLFYDEHLLLAQRGANLSAASLAVG
jgi:hypothetical protein